MDRIAAHHLLDDSRDADHQPLGMEVVCTQEGGWEMVHVQARVPVAIAAAVRPAGQGSR
jgi:hypothetical protein